MSVGRLRSLLYTRRRDMVSRFKPLSILQVNLRRQVAGYYELEHVYAGVNRVTYASRGFLKELEAMNARAKVNQDYGFAPSKSHSDLG